MTDAIEIMKTAVGRKYSNFWSEKQKMDEKYDVSSRHDGKPIKYECFTITQKEYLDKKTGECVGMAWTKKFDGEDKTDYCINSPGGYYRIDDYRHSNSSIRAFDSLSIGENGTYCDFRDTNKNGYIDKDDKVYVCINGYWLNQSASVADYLSGKVKYNQPEPKCIMY